MSGRTEMKSGSKDVTDREFEKDLGEKSSGPTVVPSQEELLALSALHDSEQSTVESLIGKVVGGFYRIESHIGEGTMSDVYKARHIVLDTYVALKMMKNKSFFNQRNLNRFIHEAKASRTLIHQSVVSIRELGLDENGQPFLVMDYVEGPSLAQILKAEHNISPARAERIFAQICAGLVHAHGKGVIHRDIKPANIIVTRDANGKELAKLVDFGVANFESSEGSNSPVGAELSGTPFYMSPEQCQQKPVTARSDIYSLGCVLYEALCGSPPYRGQSAFDTLLRHVHSDGPHFPLVHAIPRELQRTVERAIARDPKKRFQSAEEFQHALTHWKWRLRKKARLQMLVIFVLFGICTAISLLQDHVKVPTREQMIGSAADLLSRERPGQSRQVLLGVLQGLSPSQVEQRARILGELGETYIRSAIRGELPSGYTAAKKCFEEALLLTRCDSLVAATKLKLADVYRELEQPAQAAPLYTQVIRYYREKQSKSLLAQALLHEGLNRWSENKLQQALVDLREAATKLGSSPHMLIQCLHAIGCIEEKLGNPGAAEKEFSAVLQIEQPYFKHLDVWGCDSVWREIRLLERLGRHAEAQQLRDKLEQTRS